MKVRGLVYYTICLQLHKFHTIQGNLDLYIFSRIPEGHIQMLKSILSIKRPIRL